MADLEEIKMHLSEELEPSPQHERGKYICPLCGSGSHGSGSTAAFSIEKDGIHGKCFSCGFYGDIFDLVAARDGISSSEATIALVERYQPGAGRSSTSSSATRAKDQAAKVEDHGSTRDYTREIARAHSALSGSEGERYLMGRGLTAETLERFRIGYEAAHYFAGSGTFPAIMFPYNPAGGYVSWRSIGEKHFDKPKTSEAGEEPVFNEGALYTGEPVFVVESQLCAISIMQEGGRAVAIGGTGANKLLKQIKEQPPKGVLILSLDNDAAGKENQAKLARMLTEAGVLFIEENVSGDAKDPNELLQRGGGLLRKNVSSALQRVNEQKEREDRERIEQRQRESTAGYIDGFMEELRKSKAAPPINTGFPGLNKMLDGGLYPGLYIMGAITSLGKTSFAVQLCDQIAAAGHDVLFFSLEMARQELMAKSISRITYELAQRRGLSTDKAKTTRGILASNRWDRYSRDEMELMAAAIDEYREKISSHVWIYEGVGDIGVAKIREEVERHIGITGRLPVVCCDYLQILAPVEIRASDKQNTDKNVLELKRLSRDKGIPVFGISSLNRDNYTAPINNAAFKESGAIEYSSDVLIGLQFRGMDYEDGETDKAREKRIRELINGQKARGNAGGVEEIQIKILKNRNGRSGTDAIFFYAPMFNHYSEQLEGFSRVDDQDNPFTAPAKKKKPL